MATLSSGIVRKGSGSAVVRVTLADITRPLRGAELVAAVDSADVCKGIAKDMARIFLVGAGWAGRIVPSRATLSADGTFYSVTVRRYNS